MTDTSNVDLSPLPDPKVVAAEGFIPLAVHAGGPELHITTVYVRADTITGVYLPPPPTPLEEQSGVVAPGANLGLLGEEGVFSVLETPREVFDLIHRAMVMKA